MLASLKIRIWSCKKLDTDATNEVHAKNHADAGSGAYRKNLLPKDALAAVVKAAGEARTYHHINTLPWLDDGARLLPNKHYLPFAEKFRELREAFEAAVSDLLRAYPAHQEQARQSLGALYDESDYPSTDVLADKFSFEVVINPVPDADDLRVEIGEVELAAVKAAIETRAQEGMELAVRSCFERVAKNVGHMVSKLNEFAPSDGDGRAQGIFRDSLVENVRQLAETLPMLNVSNNALIQEVADRIKTDLTTYDAKSLRDNATIRQDVAIKAQAILDQVSDYI
jgi:hypothetical protein